MGRGWAALALTLFVVVASLYCVGIQPAAVTVPEALPVGLVAGTWLLLPRSTRPMLVVPVAAGVAAVYAVFDRTWGVSLGLGISAALGVWVATEVLTDRGRRPAALLSDDDLGYFVGAGFLGAFAGASGAVVTALCTGYAPWWLAGFGTMVCHLATYLTVMPHFMGRARFPSVAGSGERILQWTLMIVLTVACFLPIEADFSLVFCLIPVMGWAALRAPMRETIVQVLVVTTLTHAMTSRGLGPFATNPLASDVHNELAVIAYGVFVCAYALTVIPFSLAVGIQRRQAWRAKSEQARVRQLVRSASGVAIIGTDAEGRIDLFNPGAEKMLGYTQREVLGLSPSIFFTQAEVERLSRRLGSRASFGDVAAKLAARTISNTDVEFLRKDGEVLTLQFAMSRIHDDDGEVAGFVATGEDVTDRVKRQRALEEALAAEQVANENLKEVDQVKDALISGVSHELRTPITSILGYLEVLEDGGFGDLEPAQVRALRRVRGNSTRLLSLIDDLLMLNRIQDEFVEVVHSSLDLREVVRGARESNLSVFAAAGVRLVCEVPARAVRVQGDADRLARVLDNLLGNAAKFTERSGEVLLSLHCEGQQAVVTVSDSGIGIPASEQPRVFDRFYRAAAARERAIQGSGLGLSVAQALVRAHGGRIEVSSEPGEGSTFRVRLPLEGRVPVPEQDRAVARHQRSVT
ncbi:ATP-binding protein [Nocardioides yefusunii]|uniref:histidine kinase n=1 Tax=Nocardioides yefusunii TaxID=2500546 RepID=A0ABW1QVP4_9ACTN|nr:ATP-binding protein [Nocardioides yefusunii]